MRAFLLDDLRARRAVSRRALQDGILIFRVRRRLEVALQQALKAAAVASLVLGLQ